MPDANDMDLDIIADAYGKSSVRILPLDKLPKDKYDYIANLPDKRNEAAMQAEIQKKFGLTGRREMMQTNVLLLQIQNSSSSNLKPSNAKKIIRPYR